MFYPGQQVTADGRTATYAGAVNGTHYVYAVARGGLVPARHITPADLGAPRQLQLGAPLRRRAHVSLVIPFAPYAPYCLPRAA